MNVKALRAKKVIVDLYAGGGGTSSGVILACKKLGYDIDLTAINHWREAVETHKANYPWAKHLCEDIQFLDPRKIVPEGHLHGLVASPSCVHFSRAAGGRPKNDQQRSSAWDILRWLEFIDVDWLLVENVPEFQSYGPLDKKGFPVQSKKGETYRAWIEAVKSFNYNVETRVLNAADYGAATSRKRLFIMARKGKKPIVWPVPTHSKDGKDKPKWMPASSIIDWNNHGTSIWGRKKPLSINTRRRILEGLKKFGGERMQPFIVKMEHGGGLQDMRDPLSTITTAKGGAMALVQPFVMSQGSGGAARSVADPLFTVVAAGGGSIVEPFITDLRGGKDPHHRVSSIENPVGAIPAGGGRYGMVESFILPPEGIFRGNTPKSIEEPVGAFTQRGGGHLVEAHLIQQNHNSVGASLDKPVPSLTTNNKVGLIESCLVRYFGNSPAQSVDEPLAGITSKDRFGLVQPVINGWKLDILFRMLQPVELAAAMGFSKGYIFKGNKTETVKMIGNAVVVQVSYELCRSLLSS